MLGLCYTLSLSLSTCHCEALRPHFKVKCSTMVHIMQLSIPWSCSEREQCCTPPYTLSTGGSSCWWRPPPPSPCPLPHTASPASCSLSECSITFTIRHQNDALSVCPTPGVQYDKKKKCWLKEIKKLQSPNHEMHAQYIYKNIRKEISRSINVLFYVCSHRGDITPPPHTHTHIHIRHIRTHEIILAYLKNYEQPI